MTYKQVWHVLPALKERWYAEAGYRHVLSIAVPLILSTSAWTVQHFVDRVFLTWYSPVTIAAAMPASMVNFAIMSLFIGTAGYASTFVAQYYGAGRLHRISSILGQCLYVALIAAVVHLFLIPAAGPFFRMVGHASEVQLYEIQYFQILCLGAGPAVATTGLSAFFNGRGRAWPVMWVTAGSTLVNLLFDYAMVFGRWGFPEMGIRGAGWATVISACFSCTVLIILLARRDYRSKYRMFSGWRFDGKLFVRLIRFGLPNGVQFLLDMVGITMLLLFIGRLGTTFLAATNIAFNINTLAFMPMLGFGIAVSVLVGQYLGKNCPQMAERAVYSSFHLTFIYMGAIAGAYVLIPALFIGPFASQADPATFAGIRDLTIVLLRFVAAYSLFDTLHIIFAAAIKGAGDTRFVMVVIGIASAAILVVPSYIALVLLGRGIYTGWTIASLYIATLGFVFLLRFLGGKWKSMRVIESAPVTEKLQA